MSKSIKLKNEKVETQVYEYANGDETITINVRKSIPFVSRLEVVNNIIEACFINGAEEVDDYTPAFKEFARRIAIVSAYTDLKLPVDYEKCWLVLNKTKIYDFVLEYAKDDNIEELFASADAKIKSKVDYLVHKTDINKIIKKVFGKVDEIKNSFKGMDLEKMVDALKGAENLNEDNILDVISKIKSADDSTNNKLN